MKIWLIDKGKIKYMQKQWLYTGFILALFVIQVLGIPLFPDILAVEIIGHMNLGMSLFLMLHVLTPLLAFEYLRQKKRESD